MFRVIFFLSIAPLFVVQAQTRNLDIYWADVEGGAATLIVTPSGQSLLIDTGNPGSDDRDAKRIFEAAQAAGLKRIDYLLTTHYHSDHVGGAPALAKMIPIEHYLDHGESVEPSRVWDAYKTLAEGKRAVLKPGDKIPLTGVDVVVVASNGDTLKQPLQGGGSNEYCKDAQQKDPDKTENQRSVGVILTYGKFKFADFGDLTWDKEMELACPVNKLGTVTLMQATHHGFYADYSGAPAHVWALKPEVVVVNNGPRKGLMPPAWEKIQKSPGLEAVWQSHLALANDKAHNTSEDMIANLDPTAQCKGYALKASVSRDGSFTITNARNNVTKKYASK